MEDKEGGSMSGALRIYYRDSAGRRRALRPESLVRTARKLPAGYRVAVMWVDDDEVAFSTVPPGLQPACPDAEEITWDVGMKDARWVYRELLEEMGVEV
jgi:hypothetical protein